MAHVLGKYLGGVRSANDLKARSRVADGEDACWLWQLALDCRGTPKLWFAEFRATVTIGGVICFLKTGKRPAPDVVWYPHCGVSTCANPGHWRAGTLSAACQRHPRKNPMLHAAKVAIGRRAQSRLDDSHITDIRASTDSLDACAARHGISKTHAGNIRRGTARKSVVIPAASAFNWNGVA
jgi:hypothetical protein